MFKRYLVTAGVFLVMDVLWLTLAAPRLYRPNIGHLMAEKVNFVSAAVFYVIYVAAMVFFVINPALQNASVWRAVWTGAFLGFTMYATYDLTNMATLRDWPLVVTLADLAWGSLASAATAGISTLILK